MADIFDLFKKIESAPASKSGNVSWLIVGLGNHGTEYARTRHNVGFEAIDALAASVGVRIDRAKYHALIGEGVIDGQRVILMKPQTYMNASGEAIKAAADFYKIPPEKVIVIYDDISLPTGTLRIRKKGSAGGHNGIKSIIAQLGSDNFPRLKIGVGDRKDKDDDLKDYVLGRFSKEDMETLKKTMEKSVEALRYILDGDTDGAMSRYNG